MLSDSPDKQSSCAMLVKGRDTPTLPDACAKCKDKKKNGILISEQ